MPLIDVHPNAALSAEAAEAADRQRAFWRMHDLLLQHQRSCRPVDLVRYGADLGLDVDRFRGARPSDGRSRARRRLPEAAQYASLVQCVASPPRSPLRCAPVRVRIRKYGSLLAARWCVYRNEGLNVRG